VGLSSCDPGLRQAPGTSLAEPLLRQPRRTRARHGGARMAERARGGGRAQCGQAAARQMVEQNRAAPGRGGAIINRSSVNAVMAIPSIAGYNASKGGVNNLTRCGRAHPARRALCCGAPFRPFQGAAAGERRCRRRGGRNMALSLAPHNIRVNAIGPGSIMTPVLAAVASDRAAMNRRAPLPARASPPCRASRHRDMKQLPLTPSRQ